MRSPLGLGCPMSGPTSDELLAALKLAVAAMQEEENDRETSIFGFGHNGCGSKCEVGCRLEQIIYSAEKAAKAEAQSRKVAVANFHEALKERES